MVYLIYKCYYVLFSMSSKNNESSPWIYAMMVLSISCCFFVFFAFRFNRDHGRFK
jgi:hypothetical protein